MKKLRIAQITDIHIGPHEGLYNDIDVRAKFKQALDHVQTYDIDFIVLSGDLAIDFGELEAYKWVEKIMSAQKFPYIVMAGNHDSVDRMRSVFQIPDEQVKDGMLYFKKDLKDFPVYFLDSEPDLVHKNQLEWLENELLQESSEALLFMHHPPTLCGCQFMDRKYPLRNIAEVQSSLKRIKNIKHIFVGHYHTEKTVRFDDKIVYLTPATQMKISQTNPDFEMEPQEAGWRFIEWDGTRLKTEVKYVN
jgi:3',5'-cyclic-AMP phosphodiesterase